MSATTMRRIRCPHCGNGVLTETNGVIDPPKGTPYVTMVFRCPLRTCREWTTLRISLPWTTALDRREDHALAS